MFPPRSAYLHIPFCHRRCFYCDFAVVPLGDRAGSAAGQPGAASIGHYLAVLRREIAASPSGPPLSTVYLGGGTPSLLSPAQVADLLEALAARYGLAAGAEISLELDPASFDQQRLTGYLAAGINRVSLGGQSFDDAVLSSLGRRHRRSDLLEAISWLQAAQHQGRLGSWSLDLIEALPASDGHSDAPGLPYWRDQLDQAIASGAPHLSIYGLSVEPGTVFGKRAARQALTLPSDDLAADQHELTSQQLAAAGYGHYEISNYAQPGHASRHNRAYWSGADWWAFGLGATSASGGVRLARPRTRDAYAGWVEALERGPELSLSAPNRSRPDQALAGLPFDERVLVGLRRREGVAMETLLRLAGLGSTHQQELQALLEPERQRGLLLIEGPRWRLSDPAGLALSNAVLVKLLNWWERVGPPPTAAEPARPADAG